MIESPSNDPWIRRFYLRLQFETVPIENQTDGLGFPPEITEVPTGILRQAISGDPDAYGDIYEIYRNRVLHYCRFKVPRDEAEDCAQEVWTRVYKKLPDFEFIGIPFHNYLFAAANHICTDWWRKHRSHDDPLPDADFDFFRRASHRFDRPEDVVIARETIDEARAYIVTLNKEAAFAVVKHIEGFSHSEISQALGKSEVASRQLVSRKMRALRGHLVLNGNGS